MRVPQSGSRVSRMLRTGGGRASVLPKGAYESWTISALTRCTCSLSAVRWDAPAAPSRAVTPLCSLGAARWRCCGRAVAVEAAASCNPLTDWRPSWPTV